MEKGSRARYATGTSRNMEFLILGSNGTWSNIWALSYNGDDEYELTNIYEEDDRHTLDMKSRTCTCREWDLSGIPCPHAVAAIYSAEGTPEAYVDMSYREETYKKAYQYMMKPVRGKIFWPNSGKEPIAPPPYRKMPGRPKKSRRRKPEEPRVGKLSKKGKVMTCRFCNEVGHNIRGCPHRGTSTTSLTKRARKDEASGSQTKSRPSDELLREFPISKKKSRRSRGTMPPYESNEEQQPNIDIRLAELQQPDLDEADRQQPEINEAQPHELEQQQIQFQCSQPLCGCEPQSQPNSPRGPLLQSNSVDQMVDLNAYTEHLRTEATRKMQTLKESYTKSEIIDNSTIAPIASGRGRGRGRGLGRGRGRGRGLGQGRGRGRFAVGPGCFIDEDTGAGTFNPGTKIATPLFGAYGTPQSQIPLKPDPRTSSSGQSSALVLEFKKRELKWKGKAAVTASQLQKEVEMKKSEMIGKKEIRLGCSTCPKPTKKN
ncbi:uncharacterized protein LOC126682012 [Mercurialis annua]|uniref:uncharacterized protein LOC126682012 n=1 Tax=Mercurialis annua TaxID=3986 RepID=UPI0021605C86|nr:uncharacterized protein LOC126682012 [Mercurialis annua]